MPKRVLHLVLYLLITGGTFVAAHFLIAYEVAHEPARQGIHINGLVLLYAAVPYLLYGVVTPIFFHKISTVSYLQGFLFMCLGMILAGFFIWLGFGDGDYSTDFYPYEFVTAGLWFCLFNGGFMAAIRFWKSFQAKHRPN